MFMAIIMIPLFELSGWTFFYVSVLSFVFASIIHTYLLPERLVLFLG